MNCPALARPWLERGTQIEVSSVSTTLGRAPGHFSQAYDSFMDFQFTAVFRRVPEGYIAFVEELPGANTQGVTLDEARANLHEAVSLVLEANRTLAHEAAVGKDVIREPLKVSA
jgi:predicted RNase H-like HicB family nuclease